MNKAALTSLEKIDDYWRGRFEAMASPCECLIATDDKKLAEQLALIACNEALRIEKKFSRYRQDNIIYNINNADTQPVEVDEETANLLDFADQCYQLSEKKFDITSGVLREAWRFDGSDNIPTEKHVTNILQRVGWSQVRWQKPVLTLKSGMQIDLGGIGKEYAVDQSVKLMREKAPDTNFLVNFGGDLVATGPRLNGNGWTVGVDDPDHTGKGTVAGIEIKKAAFATSGDARRYLLKDGVRYSHILNPLTGWPVAGAPRSVSVLAKTCLEAGMMATFALLQGKNAREFLEQQEVVFWMVE